jgi:hypothetical protein
VALELGLPGDLEVAHDEQRHQVGVAAEPGQTGDDVEMVDGDGTLSAIAQADDAGGENGDAGDELLVAEGDDDIVEGSRVDA